MLRPFLAIAALGLLAALGGTSTAAAASDVSVQERELKLGLTAPASNGYQLWVETAGHRQVTLTLSKGVASATYTTTGQVSRKGIAADFGELGEISVRFDGKIVRPRRLSRDRDALGSPRARRPILHCRGRRAQWAFGEFQGTIRFEGEHGFTSVDASKGRGRMIRRYRRVCRRVETPQPKPQPRPKKHRGGESGGSGELEKSLASFKFNILTVGGEAQGRQVVMQALAFDFGSDELAGLLGTLLVATTLEHREGMQIERSTLISAGTNALDVSRGEGKPTRVDVVFPKPMEGRATLVQKQDEAPRWSGSLLVRLPGGGGVPMTGPGLSAVFCRISLLDLEESPCMRRSDALLPAGLLSGSPPLTQLLALQESGSHSQALAEVRDSWSR